MAEPKLPNSLILNDALLQGFIHGKLDSAVEEKVADFLESRPDLLEKISARSGDGFLKRLREVQQRSTNSRAVNVKTDIVERGQQRKLAAKSDASIPSALANYTGYKIITELGRGGMGVVYLAKNIQMDRLEVLKVLNERLLDHEGAKERFLREIRAVSKLSHTNIVTSYSILQLENMLVFAMEYVHGIDLQQYTHKHKPLPFGLACSFAKQIAAGLQHASDKGLVHRDIKPSNVIVFGSAGELQVKLLDFGLAKATSEETAKAVGLTQDGTMLGTPEYMSPEQSLNAAKADIRADIYSLGCTLYYMLSGEPPFTGTHGAVLLAHAQREPQALNLIRPDIPADLAAVVGKMLAKDLHKRFQTPSQVASALSPFVNQSRQSTKQQAAGEAPVSNTVNDLNGPDRETSVEVELSELSLDNSSHPDEPQIDVAILAGAIKENVSLSKPQPDELQKSSKAHTPNWFIPTVVTLGTLLFLGALWQLASLTFRTSNGTIVVENMPADAEVLIDGQKIEIAWNEGRDKAQVSINAGSHQLRVLNQGNEIYGEKVSVRGGGSTVVKLSVVKPGTTVSNESAARPSIQADNTLSSTTRTEFILIPSGTFTMGSPKKEVGRQTNEVEHQVTISKPFYLGKYEVSQGEFKQVMGYNPSYVHDSDLLPVENVSWYDAIKFCNKLSEKDGLQPAYRFTDETKDGDIIVYPEVTWNRSANGYRLPTEAEWEYACRAGSQKATPFSFGNQITTSQVNFKGDFPYNNGPKSKLIGGPVKIKQLMPNAFGIHQMHGNICEWCWDWYSDYEQGPQTDPAGPASGRIKVSRGSHWNDYAVNCRTAKRNRGDPKVSRSFRGFRIAHDVLTH